MELICTFAQEWGDPCRSFYCHHFWVWGLLSRPRVLRVFLFEFLANPILLWWVLFEGWRWWVGMQEASSVFQKAVVWFCYYYAQTKPINRSLLAVLFSCLVHGIDWVNRQSADIWKKPDVQRHQTSAFTSSWYWPRKNLKSNKFYQFRWFSFIRLSFLRGQDRFDCSCPSTSPHGTNTFP